MDRHFLPTIGYVADTMSAVSPPTASSESNTHAIHITEPSPSAAVLSDFFLNPQWKTWSIMKNMPEASHKTRTLSLPLPKGVTYNSISG